MVSIQFGWRGGRYQGLPRSRLHQVCGLEIILDAQQSRLQRLRDRSGDVATEGEAGKHRWPDWGFPRCPCLTVVSFTDQRIHNFSDITRQGQCFPRDSGQVKQIVSVMGICDAVVSVT